MDGENHGKPLFFNGWFGGTIIFGNTHLLNSKTIKPPTSQPTNHELSSPPGTLQPLCALGRFLGLTANIFFNKWSVPLRT